MKAMKNLNQNKLINQINKIILINIVNPRLVVKVFFRPCKKLSAGYRNPMETRLFLLENSIPEPLMSLRRATRIAFFLLANLKKDKL